MEIQLLNFNTVKYNSLYGSNKNTFEKNVQKNGINNNAFSNELYMIKNYNIAFCGKTTAKPIYAIDEGDELYSVSLRK